MNSADSSGVNRRGFGSEPAHAQACARSPDRPSPSSTPIPLVIVAIAGCLLFTIHDTYRTVFEVQDRLELIASLASAQIAPRDLDAPRDQPFSIPPALSENTQFALAASDGEVLASTIPGLEAGEFTVPDAEHPGLLSASASIADGLAEITVTTPYMDVAQTVLLRSGAVACGGLLVLLVAFRRRAPAYGKAHDDRQEAFEPAIEAVPYGFARWSEEGVLICANAAFSRLLSLDAELILPGTGYETVSRSIRGRIIARPVLNATHQRVVEVERADGTTLMLDERPCDGGGFITVATDITDRRAADRMLADIREEQRQLARRYHEEKLRAEAASRAKTTFLAHLSHDIRTPLNHIIGFADLIGLETYGPLGDPKYRSYVRDIKQSGERLLASFAEILEYAELEGGGRALKCENITLDDLLQAVAARVRDRAKRAGVRLEVSRNQTGMLHADRHCIERMLGNLLDNAIRFTPRGGQVRLASWVAGDGVVIEVSDTGIGIPEEQLARLSEPFAYPDATFTRQHEGSGLGIAIARTIAELSGGRLAIDSMVGVGTTVAVSLPLAADTPVEVDQAA